MTNKTPSPLAVMEHGAVLLDLMQEPEAAANLTEARAAVAELVEAAKLAAKINPFGSVENATARDAAIAALAKFAD
jgi:hypothetical protein